MSGCRAVGQVAVSGPAGAAGGVGIGLLGGSHCLREGVPKRNERDWSTVGRKSRMASQDWSGKEGRVP